MNSCEHKSRGLLWHWPFKNISAIFLVIICILSSAPQALARPIVANISPRSVDITHDFDGRDVLLYGARTDVGRIIVVLRGPRKDYVVRKKERVGGLWINNQSAVFRNVDSFYTIASTHNLSEIDNNALLTHLQIGNTDQLIIRASGPLTTEQEELFRKAFINERVNSQLYSPDVRPISFLVETLFDTTLRFPRNIERGWYTAEVYLFNNGQLSAMQSTPIEVRKKGFEAFMFDFAHNHAPLYGIVCVLIALLSGWLASTLFGRGK